MRIKLLIKNKFISLVFGSIVLLRVFAFNEFGLDCYVRGYVYRDNNTVSLSREDNCDRVGYETYNGGIVLYSKHYWVFVPIDESVKGFESFYYRWGNSRAYIHGRPVDIEWGYVLGG